MTDKELLELAAKAAGIDGEYRWNGYGTGSFVTPTKDGNVSWNPLTDDGDALRLAVKLGLGIHLNHHGVEIRWKAEHLWEEAKDIYYDDFYIATRRAIVRAAAEIGKEMK